MATAEDSLNQEPRPMWQGRVGKAAFAVLAAIILVLSAILYLETRKPESHDDDLDELTPVLPHSVIINGTSLTLTANSIMWLNTSEPDLEDGTGLDWSVDWTYLQVRIGTNDSEVGWALQDAEEMLSIGIPSVESLGEGWITQGSVHSLSFSLIVADITGNGRFDFGDYFIAYTENDTLLIPGTEWYISLAFVTGVFYSALTFRISISEDGFEVRDFTRYDF